MSFSFSFSGDDIEPDDEDTKDASSGRTALATAQVQSLAHIPPKKYTLTDLLSELPSQISYDEVSIPRQPHPLIIGRRSHFDIRAQLMAESSSVNENDALIASIASGDLSTGQYEGGFKTWECAVDLATLLANDSSYASFFDNRSDTPTHIIELGAGSAIPSLTLLRRAVQQSTDSGRDRKSLVLTLADYNADVLKLCTAPNVFLNAYLPFSNPVPDNPDQIKIGHDLDLESIQPELRNFTKTLSSHNINVNLISGAWGGPFMDILNSFMPTNSIVEKPNILVLASETIYSPGTLHIFTSTLLSILRLGGTGSKALIAAKQIYFGVGGGVADFERELRRQNSSAVSRVVWASEGGNTVGRVVLEVEVEAT